MENKKIYGDDVERIVNDPERQKKIKEKHLNIKSNKQTKLLTKTTTFALIAIVFAVMGTAGWLVDWIAFSALSVFGVYSFFCFGRWFENGKIMGWKI